MQWTAPAQVERWSVFELTCQGRTDGNPFVEVTISGAFASSTCRASGAGVHGYSHDARVNGGEVKAMELLLELEVSVGTPYSVQGASVTVCMVPFTAQAHGRYFNGETIGQCVDTQHIVGDGQAVLSARYMLQGVDCSGKRCKVFIENNGKMGEGFTPTIVTDSEALRDWETATLCATVRAVENSVQVRLYKG